MIPTMADPTRLKAFLALQQAGLSPAEIRQQMRISRRTFFYWKAELARVATRAKAVESNSPH